MGKLLVGLLVTASLWASPRTVSGPLRNPSATGANGTVRVEWQTFTAGDGSLVVAGSRTTTVTSGTYSQTFEPTGDASPSGVTYKVTYNFGSSSPAICYWVIPAGSGTVLIADIQTCSLPSSPAGQIALSQLSIGGGSNGQCAIISAGIWAPATCPNVAGFTAGSVIFTNSTPAFAQDNANFFYNSTDKQFCIGCSSTGATVIKFRVFSTGSTQALVDAATGNNSAQLSIDSGGGGGSSDSAILGFSSDGTSKWLVAGVWNGVSDFVIRDPESSFLDRFKIVKATGVVQIRNLAGSGTKYVCVDNSGNLSVGATC